MRTGIRGMKMRKKRSFDALLKGEEPSAIQASSSSAAAASLLQKAKEPSPTGVAELEFQGTAAASSAAAEEPSRKRKASSSSAAAAAAAASSSSAAEEPVTEPPQSVAELRALLEAISRENGNSDDSDSDSELCG